MQDHHQPFSDSPNGKLSQPSILPEETQSEDLYPVTDEEIPEPPPTTQPPERRWRGISISLAVLLLLVGGAVGWRWWQSNQAPKESPAQSSQPRGIPVKLSTVETSTVEDTSDFVGTLEAQKSLQLRTETEGRVSQIDIKAGDAVRQGEIIARLDSEEVRASLMQERANLLRAQAQLKELQAGSRPEEIAKAKAALAEAQARLTNAKSGSRTEEVAVAEAQVESARADAALKLQQLSRYQALRQQGAISQNDLDRYVAENRSAQANLREAQRRLEQTLKNRQSDIQQLAAAVEQQRQALTQLQNGTRPEEIAQAEAQVAQAAAQVRAQEVRLNNTAVRAPFAGVIGDVPVKIGDYLKTGDPLTTLTQNQTLELRLPVPVERQSQLNLGLPVQILSPQGEPIATGRVSFVSPQVSDSQAILAKASFDNPNRELRDGQFVRARIVWNSRPNAIVIPTNAVIFQGQERFIYLAEEQGSRGVEENGQSSMIVPQSPSLVAKLQPIQLGLVKGDRAEVVAGLQPGTQIIVSGTQKLADGAPIMPLGGTSNQVSR